MSEHCERKWEQACHVPTDGHSLLRKACESLIVEMTSEQAGGLFSSLHVTSLARDLPLLVSRKNVVLHMSSSDHQRCVFPSFQHLVLGWYKALA